MNTGKVGAFVTAHKKELMIGGAGVAVAGGLYAHNKAPAGSDSPTGTTVAAAGSGAPMPSAGGSGYDSSSSDVYNALQPQIETTQRQLDGTQTLLQKLIDQLKLTPVPVKVTPKVVPKVVTKPPPRKVVPKKVAPKVKPPVRRIPPKAPHPPAKRVYVVRKGDNLSIIAKRLALPGGAATGWRGLYSANRTVIGANANKITPGQRLVY